eukprot:UN05246
MHIVHIIIQLRSPLVYMVVIQYEIVMKYHSKNDNIVK